MPTQRKDPNASGDEYKPRKSGTRKKATPAKASKAHKVQTPVASQEMNPDTTTDQAPVALALASNVQSQLAESLLQTLAGIEEVPVTPPRSTTDRPRNISNPRKPTAPTPSSDGTVVASTQRSAQPSRIKGPVKGQLRLPDTSAQYFNNVDITSNLNSRPQAPGIYQFGQNQQLPAPVYNMTFGSTNTSSSSPVAAQMITPLRRGALNRGAITRGSPVVRTLTPRGQTPSQEQNTASLIRKLPVAFKMPSFGGPIMLPTGQTYDMDPAGDPMDYTPTSFNAIDRIQTSTNEKLKKAACTPAALGPGINSRVRFIDTNVEMKSQPQPNAMDVRTPSSGESSSSDIHHQFGGEALPEANGTINAEWDAPEGVNKSTNIDDWPKNPFLALEPYITKQGVWDESDRLYMMGIQAGIGMGIVAHKSILVEELRNSSKLWGMNVTFTPDGHIIPDPAKIVENIDVFEKLAAMQAANDYIMTREVIAEHARELVALDQQKQNIQRGAAGPNEGHAQAVVAAHIQRHGIQPTATGPVGSYTVDPNLSNASVPASFLNHSLPSGRGLDIYNEAADLRVMAGSQTIGGLNLSRIDGLAGALSNAFLLRQQHQSRRAYSASLLARSAQGLIIKVPQNGCAASNLEDSNASHVHRPTLSETENGRAVIKMIKGEKMQ